MDIKPGKSYHIYDSQNASRVVKAHVMHIVDGCYQDEQLIIYRFYGKYKRWWHQCLLTKERFIEAIEFAQRIKQRNNG